jgi:hypothetical protein
MYNFARMNPPVGGWRQPDGRGKQTAGRREAVKHSDAFDGKSKI